MSEEMTYAHLGRSGLLVSRIGLGTMNFGCTVDEPSSFAVMDSAIDAGISFFDTADVYGGPQSADMKKGLRRRGGDGRPVAAAQRTPRRHRLGHEGVPADGTRSERPPAVRVAHPPRV
jgi:predicted aldo/keto reductase-like oxidoreductase